MMARWIVLEDVDEDGISNLVLIVHVAYEYDLNSLPQNINTWFIQRCVRVL